MLHCAPSTRSNMRTMPDTPTQSLEAEYAASRPRSQALHVRARASLPGGISHDGRVIAPFPFYVDRADGARKWDVDGHAYLDAWSGHGSLVLGHNHPAVVDAITKQASRGLHYSACHELELRWAELVRECVPVAERVRFTVTGTETNALALKVARACTGRTRVIKFEGHFHGLHDYLIGGVKYPFREPASVGVPKAATDTVCIVRHGDLEATRTLLEAGDVAAVILEPAAAHSAVAPTDPEFLRQLRRLTREHGTVLIFDEVVTGFRMAPGGAQEYFGVTADLVSFAKAIAGGLPGAALVGRADLLDSIAFTADAEHNRMRRVADQGTHSAAPLVAAAGVATLEILKTGEPQRHLNALGDRVRDGFNGVLERRGLAGHVYGHSSIFRIFLGESREQLGLHDGSYDHEVLDRGMGPIGAALHLAMLINGVDYARGLAIGWLNAAMTEADIDRMVTAFDQSLDRLAADGVRLRTAEETRGSGL